MLEVTLLGTAALMPLPGRGLSSAAIQCDGHVILLDCGEGTQIGLRRFHISPLKIDLIALTHYHGDHLFGLPGLLQSMLTANRTEPLYITGPAGLQKIMKPLLELTGYLPFRIILCECPYEKTRLCSFLPGWAHEAFLTAFDVKHRVPCVGYTFDLERVGRFCVENAVALGVPQNCWSNLQKGETLMVNERTVTPDMVLGEKRKGLRVTFSGDTMPCQNLLTHAHGADLLICEGTYGDDAFLAEAKERGHMTFSQAGALAAEAEVKALWLTHFSQIMPVPEEFLPFATRHFPDAVCGVDGMKAELCFEDQTSSASI